MRRVGAQTKGTISMKHLPLIIAALALTGTPALAQNAPGSARKAAPTARSTGAINAPSISRNIPAKPKSEARRLSHTGKSPKDRR